MHRYEISYQCDLTRSCQPFFAIRILSARIELSRFLVPTKIKWFKPNMFHPWCQTRDNSFGRIPPKIADKICVTYHKWRGYYFILKWNSGTIIPHFHDLPSILSPFQWKHTMTRYLVPGIYIDFANTANHSICHWRVYSFGEIVMLPYHWHLDKDEYMDSRFLQ